MRYLSVLAVLLTTLAATGCADSPPPTPRTPHSHTHDTSHSHQSDLPDTQPRDTATPPDTSSTDTTPLPDTNPSPPDTDSLVDTRLDTTDGMTTDADTSTSDGGPKFISQNNVMWQLTGSYVQTTGPLTASYDSRHDQLTITDGTAIHIRIPRFTELAEQQASSIECDDPSLTRYSRISVLTYGQKALPFIWRNLELSPSYPDCTLHNYPDTIHTWLIDFEILSPQRIKGLLGLTVLGQGPRQSESLYIVSKFDLSL